MIMLNLFYHELMENFKELEGKNIYGWWLYVR